MELCPRHDDALDLALELRGLRRPGMVFDAAAFARQAIGEHCTNLAGRAAIEMLTKGAGGKTWCPLCFCNTKNPSGINLDSWIEHAADDALQESKVSPPPTKIVLVA